MRLPTMARTPVSLLAMVVASSFSLTGCAGDATSPSAAKPSTPEAISSFVPTDASKALYGVVDGTYSVTFDPTQNQSFSLGPNHLDMPANSVCKLVGSGYGSSYWNQSCTTETLPVTITVVIKDAATDHPRMDFYPAMRFNPTKLVQLFMYVPGATQQDARNWVMQYCTTVSSLTGTSNYCVDESLKDADLTSYVDRQAQVVFRRIKHFSGYVVAE